MIIEATIPYVKLAKFCADTGYTVKAIERKMEEGVLLKGVEYHKAPDGKILVDVKAFNLWAQGKRQVGVTQ